MKFYLTYKNENLVLGLLILFRFLVTGFRISIAYNVTVYWLMSFFFIFYILYFSNSTWKIYTIIYITQFRIWIRAIGLLESYYVYKDHHRTELNLNWPDAFESAETFSFYTAESFMVNSQKIFQIRFLHPICRCQSDIQILMRVWISLNHDSMIKKLIKSANGQRFST